MDCILHLVPCNDKPNHSKNFCKIVWKHRQCPESKIYLSVTLYPFSDFYLQWSQIVEGSKLCFQKNISFSENCFCLSNSADPDGMLCCIGISSRSSLFAVHGGLYCLLVFRSTLKMALFLFFQQQEFSWKFMCQCDTWPLPGVIVWEKKHYSYETQGTQGTYWQGWCFNFHMYVLYFSCWQIWVFKSISKWRQLKILV